MLSFIGPNVSAYKLINDDRNEIKIFGGASISDSVSIRLPSISFWTLELMIIILTTLLSCAIATVIFKRILSRPKSITTLTTGFGVLIPLCVYFPFLCIEFFKLRNIYLRFLVAFPCALWFFRILEAIFGFTPVGSVRSLKTYIVYFSTIGEVVIDQETKKFVPVTSQYVVTKMMICLGGMVFLGLYSSILYHFDFELFKSGSFDGNVKNPYTIQHMLNLLTVTGLLQLILMVCTMPFGLFTNIVYGVKVHTIQKNSFDSKSATDFWGKKWNRLISGLLRRGIYKPVRTQYSTGVAVICTFVVSGLLHEWLAVVLFFAIDDDKDEAGICQTCYVPKRPGIYMIFFMYCALVMVAELYIVKRVAIVKKILSKLPMWFIVGTLFMISFPVGQWMSSDLVKSKAFHHLQLGLPTLMF